jgi:hypothetical protein
MDEPRPDLLTRRALGRIQQFDNDMTKARLRRADAVREARERGVTWRQVGTVLGISPQAAQQAFPIPEFPSLQPRV